jgi:hypothetical protein
MVTNIIKYVRTPHIRGSRKSGDDFELEDFSFEDVLRGKHVVYEIKLDGSNTGISFDDDESLLLQSRGHYLRGGRREKEFDMLKVWANRFRADLYDCLGKRYVMYSESLCAKHTIFYDNLPHYIFEFDVYDKEKGLFLSTKARRRLLEGLEYESVPVAYEGEATTLEHLKSFIGRSRFKTNNWKKNLSFWAYELGQNEELIKSQTDMSDTDEGIYIKVETEEETIGRFKFVRNSFTNTVLNSGNHWHDRPIFPNQLALVNNFKL